MPRDLVITTPVPDTVSVRLRGRISDLRSLSSQNLEVTLDVSWVTPGDAVITLSPQAMSVPPQIDVVSMEPTKVRFRVEALRQTVVPIRPFLVGQPPPGYIAGDPTLVPDHALVSGPASQIRNVTEVATERIIMTGRSETFVQTVPSSATRRSSGSSNRWRRKRQCRSIPRSVRSRRPLPTSETAGEETATEKPGEKPAETKPPVKSPSDRKRRNKREQ